ncbi:hypothetical protein TNCV_4536261 [Trichonephila clavipes]|nr:hypothetical protein TNCV_4536261 [Trichonephila clavipes]
MKDISNNKHIYAQQKTKDDEQEQTAADYMMKAKKAGKFSLKMIVFIRSGKTRSSKIHMTSVNRACDWWKNIVRTATAGSDVVQSGRPIFDDFFQHLWPYIGNNTANVVFQMVKRLWLIRIDQ